MITIDEYLSQLKTRKDTLQLQLTSVNTEMSTIRAHFQQSQGNIIFKQAPAYKDRKLKKLQPTKEKLQKEILAVKTEIVRVQGLKKQGVAMVDIKH